MPNHITNILTLVGRSEEVEKVFAFIKGENGDIDFNKIIRMPKALDIESSSMGDTGMHYLKAQAKMCFDTMTSLATEAKPHTELSIFEKNAVEYMSKASPKDKKKCLSLGRKYLSNMHKYGYTTWYDWCRAKWGTKWNAYDIYRDGDTIEFNTAWSAPAPVIAQLSKKFPKVEFQLLYADEDASYNTGDIIFNKGEADARYPDGGSPEAWEIYFTTHEGARDFYEFQDDGTYKYMED